MTDTALCPCGHPATCSIAQGLATFRYCQLCAFKLMNVTIVGVKLEKGI